MRRSEKPRLVDVGIVACRPDECEFPGPTIFICGLRACEDDCASRAVRPASGAIDERSMCDIVGSRLVDVGIVACRPDECEFPGPTIFICGLRACEDDCASRAVRPASGAIDERPMCDIVGSIRLEVVAECCRVEAGGAIIVGERDRLGTASLVPGFDSEEFREAPDNDRPRELKVCVGSLLVSERSPA